MKTTYITKPFSLTVAASLVAVLILTVVAASTAKAAPLTSTFVRFDRMKIGTATTGTVCATPATVATEASVIVSFPTGYTVSTTTGNWTVNTTNTAWPTGAQAWVGAGTATAAAGQDVTFPSGELTVGTMYCFNWTNSAAVTVKGTATASNQGTITTRTVAPADIDTGGFTTASVTDDQIVVTATVPQLFSFALSDSTDNIGSITTGAISSSPTPRTATVNTNAKNGWLMWARSANTGLTSATASKTIASTTPGSNSVLTGTTEGYNTGITTSQVGGSGTVSVPAAFVGTGAGQGGGLDTSLRTVASSNGTADTAVVTIENNVSISPTTPAASDYTDTITVVAAGLF